MNLILQKAIEPFQGITLLQLGAFVVPFIIAVWIDLRSHKKGQAITMGDAAKWSAIWVFCALLFAGFVYWNQGAEFASLYLTGYVLEKALAVDNLFAFFLIFKSFGLTLDQNQPLQHRILYWGIIGAILLRVLFLGAGAFIVNIGSPVLIVFAGFILYTVWKMWKSGDDDEVDYKHHRQVYLPIHGVGYPKKTTRQKTSKSLIINTFKIVRNKNRYF
jgi:tellurite resistance protein TerC